MKIIHIGQLIGGLDIYIRNTITYTDSSFEFICICGEEDGNKPISKNGETIKEYPISLRRALNPIKDIKGIWQTIQIIRKEKPDAIHCHSAKGGMIGRIAGWVTRTKTFYTPHAFSFLSTPSNFKKNIFIFLEKLTRFNTYILACSESERELAIKQVGYKKKRAYAWNNAVPDASKLIPKAADTDKKDSYICYIGRPSYQKNSLFLVEVIKEVHKKHPNIKFKLIGVGYYSPDLDVMKSKIATYSLTDVIELVPWIKHEDSLNYVKESLCYLTVSRYEGLPLAVIEALSLGKAVIASNVVGNKDCIRHKENGYLLPLDINEFSDALCEIIENPEKRMQYEINAREYFKDNFLIDHRIKELEYIYKSV